MLRNHHDLLLVISGMKFTPYSGKSLSMSGAQMEIDGGQAVVGIFFSEWCP